jgi:hypothetical protein
MKQERIVFSDIDKTALQQCEVGTLFKLWTKDDLDEIFAYVKGSLAGRGKIATLTRRDNPEISQEMDRDNDVWLEIIRKESTSIILETRSGPRGAFAKASAAARKKRQP